MSPASMVQTCSGNGNVSVLWTTILWMVHTSSYSPNVFEFRMTLCNKSIEMISSSSRQLTESREETVSAVQAILKKQESVYEIVDFETFNKTYRLRSKHYSPYSVVCFKNTTRWSVWCGCLYLMNGGCQPDKSVFSISTILVNTSKLDHHTRVHTQIRAMPSCLVRNLPRDAKQTIAKSAPYAVALDLRPLSFSMDILAQLSSRRLTLN